VLILEGTSYRSIARSVYERYPSSAILKSLSPAILFLFIKPSFITVENLVNIEHMFGLLVLVLRDLELVYSMGFYCATIVSAL